MNVVAWLEFELAYFKVTVKYFIHYIMGTPIIHNWKETRVQQKNKKWIVKLIQAGSPQQSMPKDVHSVFIKYSLNKPDQIIHIKGITFILCWEKSYHLLPSLPGSA